jgi:hypothetical protein
MAAPLAAPLAPLQTDSNRDLGSLTRTVSVKPETLNWRLREWSQFDPGHVFQEQLYSLCRLGTKQEPGWGAVEFSVSANRSA